MKLTYKDAGVDVVAGEALVDWLKNAPRNRRKNRSVSQSETARKGKDVVSGIGGFAALYRARFQGMKRPTLVSCTDGVGTKVLVASHFGDFRGVGQDLVAMCVNDLVCTGGEPLFFLDYYATGKLNLKSAKQFLHSVRDACSRSSCVLIGGETAEMPGVYAPTHFDCAGFAVGVVDEEKAWGPRRVKEGDVLIAIGSSGFHSNGYSLLRKVFRRDLKKWRRTLLTPTALYVDVALSLRKLSGVVAAAHITGGGLDNIPRVLPAHHVAELEAWRVPPPFLEVKRRARLDWPDLLTSLNCGVGFVVIGRAEAATKILNVAHGLGHTAWQLGFVRRNGPRRGISKGSPGWSVDFSHMERLNQ
jgi:phosphoribosylformylglycinamidine cyclo-ligase